MDKYEKILSIFLILYFILLVYRLDYINFLWDEAAANAPVIFWKDFLKYYIKNPTLNLNELKLYGMDYQSHYIFFSQMLYHPPLCKILVLFSTFLFGINEFGIRFPSIIFGVVGLFFTYMTGKEISGKKSIGLLSAIFLGLSPIYYQFSRFSIPDIPVAVMMTISMFFLLRYLKYKKIKYSILFGLSFGLCLLTKFFGIYIGLALALFIVLTKKYKILKDLNIYLGCFLTGLIFVPWLLFLVFAPKFLDIPFESFGKYASHVGFSIDPISLLTFHIKQFSYAIGILSIFGFLYIIKRREHSDIFLISWILPCYLFPLFFISSSSGHLYRFTMSMMPALAISGSIFLEKIMNYKKIKNYRYFLLACLLLSSLLLSINYNLRANIRYPVEDAAIWVLQNTPKDGGVLYDDKGLQLYLMKYDRNLTIRAADCRAIEQLDAFLNQEYLKIEYEKFGVKNPKFHYFITKQPLKQSDNFLEKMGERDIYTNEQSFLKELFDYIGQNEKQFKLRKIFYGNSEETNVYVYEIIDTKNI